MTNSTQLLHIVIGLPGSGKTTYLDKLLADGVVDRCFDDYQKGAPKDESNPRLQSDPHLSPSYADLRAALSAGKNVAIADIRYCVQEEQKIIQDFVAAEFPGVTGIMTYFANNPAACKYNVRLRNREGYIEKELANIDILTLEYNPPQNQSLPVIMG